MGNTLASQTPALEFYLNDLDGYVFERTLGNGKFVKTLRCAHSEGSVIVKVYIRRDGNNAQMKDAIDEQLRRLTKIRELFERMSAPAHNLWPYQRVEMTEAAVYAIRQYFYSSARDRISGRPALAHVDRLWLAYQMLAGLGAAHDVGVSHGDLKLENVMVTTYNWVLLTDWASYKPTHVPEDSPALFSLFFDSSARRTCYLAPERFVTVPPSGEEDAISSAMDIFALGCAIAELFLDGAVIFTFAQMRAFRRNEYSPLPLIDKIAHDDVRALVLSMIERDPLQRLAAEQYMRWPAFPACFQRMHTAVAAMLELDADARVRAIAEHLANEEHVKVDLGGGVSVSTRGDDDDGEEVHRVGANERSDVSAAALPPLTWRLYFADTDPKTLSADVAPPLPELLESTRSLLTELNDILECGANEATETAAAPDAESLGDERNASDAEKSASEHKLNDSGAESRDDASGGDAAASVDDTALLLLIPLLTSSLRSCVRAQSRRLGLQLLVSVAEHVGDAVIMHRLVPYAVAMLHDESAVVRVAALRALTVLLARIKRPPSSDLSAFPEYLLPLLSNFVAEEKEELVLIAFLGVIPSLAATSRVFLEQNQLYEQSSSDEQDQRHFHYDSELENLQTSIYELIVDVFSAHASSSALRRALFTDIERLCLFFGPDKTNDFIVPLIITFLNDRDWQLRAAFFRSIVAIGAFVGRQSTEVYLLECMMQKVTDDEEFVVARAVAALAGLCELDLLSTRKCMDAFERTAPLLLHPNAWIRYSAVAVAAAVLKTVDGADAYCFAMPLLRPYLCVPLRPVPPPSATDILNALVSPLRREVFDDALRRAHISAQGTVARGPGLSEPMADDKAVHFEGTDAHVLGSDEPKSALIVATSTGGAAQRDSAAEAAHSGDEELERAFFERRLSEDGSEASGDEQGAPPSLLSLVSGGHRLNESDKLRLMNDYIVRASIAFHNFNRGRIYERDLQAALDTEHYENLSSSVPVHGVVLPEHLPDAPLPTLAIVPSSTAATAAAAATTTTATSNTPAATSIADMTRLFTSAPLIDAALRLGRVPPPAPPLGLLTRGALTGTTLQRGWRPRGILVAHLYEHAEAVNELAVSDDNMFFVSASADGTFRVWDCARLETNISNRSKLTYSAQGGNITSAVVCEGSHSVASASSNGTVHVVRLECAPRRSEHTGLTTYRYRGTSVVSVVHANAPVNVVRCFDDKRRTVLLYGTARGELLAHDLRVGAAAFALRNRAQFGAITALVVGPDARWLLCGTARGYYTLWDLRFGAPLQSWQHSAQRPIARLVLAEAPPDRSGEAGTRHGWVYSASGGHNNEVELWNVETAACRRLFRTASADRSDRANQPNVIKAVRPVRLSRGPRSALYVDSALTDIDDRIVWEQTKRGALAHVSVAVGSDAERASGDEAANEDGREEKAAAAAAASVGAILHTPNGDTLLTGSSDKRIRLFDLENGTRSYTLGDTVISGDDPVELLEDEKVRYAATYNCIRTATDFAIYQELPIDEHRRRLRAESHRGADVTAVPSPQHRDAITDLKALEMPRPLLLSSARDGVVQVWK